MGGPTLTDYFTLYANLQVHVTSLTSAQLPAAATTNDGLLVIEDVGGVGNKNLIYYVGDERYRISGTQF